MSTTKSSPTAVTENGKILQLNFNPEMLKVNMKKIFYIIIFSFIFLNNSYALIEVDITRGNLDPLPIAFPHCMSILNQKTMRALK